MYLLDTNVISELRKRKPHGGVIAWISPFFYEELYVPAIAIGELQVGVELTRQQDTAKAAELELWVERIATEFTVLSMDVPCFREWARMMHGKSEHLNEDAMIAATASVHKLTVVTRNVKDFAAFDVPTLNPFSYKH
jgi:predicted nucleic acid-binding protein